MSFLGYAYKQINDWSCGPAVARIVLHYFGQKKTFRELTRELRITRAGTKNAQIIKLFKKNDIDFIEKKDSKLGDIKRYLRNNIVIVAYYIPRNKESHYAIVKKINSRRIYFHDTWFGSSHSYTLNYFYKNWWDSEAKKWILAVKK